MPQPPSLQIRPETPADIAAVDLLVGRCFASQDNAPAAEVALVQQIRALPNFDPALSLVADRGGTVIGHLLFSPMVIDSPDGAVPALALAPLAVLPGYESSHAGTRLMREGLAACRGAGHRIVIVLGHPKYYRRFGFRPARSFGIHPPGESWPHAAFQALELVPGAISGISGRACYAPPFNV